LREGVFWWLSLRLDCRCARTEQPEKSKPAPEDTAPGGEAVDKLPLDGAGGG
jgi:hypothetical protein